MYCERCKRLFEGGVCPQCRKAKWVRTPRPEDPCFLTEQGQPYAGMLAEVLDEQEIPCLMRGRLGAGLAAKFGPMLESTRFYVRHDDLERAREAVRGLFGEDALR